MSTTQAAAVTEFTEKLRKDSETRILGERGVTLTTYNRGRDGYSKGGEYQKEEYARFEFDRPEGFIHKPHVTIHYEHSIHHYFPRAEFAVGKFVAEVVKVIDLEGSDSHHECSHYEVRFSGDGIPQSFSAHITANLFCKIYGDWRPDRAEECPLTSARLTLGALISEFGEKLAGPLASEERAKIEKMNVICAELLLSLLY